MVLTTCCRGISAVAYGATPPSPYSLTWMFPSHSFHILTPLSHSHSSLSAAVSKVLSMSLVVSGSANGMSILRMIGTGFIEHGGNFWNFLIEATPAVPSCSTKTMSCKPSVLDKFPLFWLVPIQNISAKIILQAFHPGNDTFLHQSSTVPLSLSHQVDAYCLLCFPFIFSCHPGQ